MFSVQKLGVSKGRLEDQIPSEHFQLSRQCLKFFGWGSELVSERINVLLSPSFNTEFFVVPIT